MKNLMVVCICLAVASPALATGAYSYVGAPNSVPDDAYDGTLASMTSATLTVPAGEPGGDIVSGIAVSIDMSHTWVGDLVLKLEGPGGLMTLMSRPAYAEPADDGSGCCGDSSNWVFGAPQRFVDGAAISAEDLGVGQPSSADPIPAQDLDPHGGVLGDTSLMGTFGGMSAVGDWTVYVGDGAGGDLGDLARWTLDLTTVPEPASLLLMALGALVGIRRR